MTKQLTFGSLFAGIGGFDLGFERAGMKCLWQVEIDDYATRVLEKHWPDVRRWRDVRECGAANLERVDVICGGFPCQDISYAGLGAGLAGERSGLFYEAIRIVREMGPRFIVLENVSALLTRGMGDVLGTLAACGLDAEWGCLPASCIGAPHLRDRVFIVAHTTQERSPFTESIFAREAARELGGDYRDPRSSWRSESGVCPVADGIPFQLEQLAGYGNAVVPQVAEWIGRRIVEANEAYLATPLKPFPAES